MQNLFQREPKALVSLEAEWTQLEGRARCLQQRILDQEEVSRQRDQVCRPSFGPFVCRCRPIKALYRRRIGPAGRGGAEEWRRRKLSWAVGGVSRSLQNSRYHQLAPVYKNLPFGPETNLTCRIQKRNSQKQAFPLRQISP